MEHSLYVAQDADSIKDIKELNGMISALEGLQEHKQIYIPPILTCPTYSR